MRYWDASAIVPLVISESASKQARKWLDDDAEMVTWAFTIVEIHSAVERRVREGRLSRRERRDCLSRFSDLAGCWDEVIDLDAVRSRALALLARHKLRAADAAQLASASLVAGDDPRRLTFVCLDQGLALAAEREGFSVLV